MSQLTENRVEEIAELQVRRYFDRFLADTLPKVVKAHDSDAEAHGGIRRKVDRMRMVMLFVIGAGGFFSGTLAESLLNLL